MRKSAFMFHFKRGLSEKADLIKYGAAVESSRHFDYDVAYGTSE